MKLKGAWAFPAPRPLVWDTLIDPDAVAHCIPGCERMVLTGEDEYDAILSVGVGAVRGRYTGRVRLADQRHPECYRLLVEGASRVGFVRGEGLISLAEEEGQTVVAVEGQVQVGGTIASVGHRVIHTTATALMNRFFQGMRERLASAGEEPATD